MLRTPSHSPRRQPPLRVATVALALALAGTLAGCGETKEKTAAPSAAVKECRAQWRELGQSIVGMDEDQDPSALAARWTTILATVDYYENTATAAKCEETIENQRSAIAALRQLTEKLRPYDMTYQRSNIAASVDLYLHDPLPKAARDDEGDLVQPQPKKLVRAAAKVLEAYAETANTELGPGWEQALSVNLDDEDAVTTTIEDLDFLAQDSVAWQQCQAALQILVAAQQAQQAR